ncbi:Bug family tripartite tricarboxylate transporter substrate binding protein [Ottowia thiooxydans]|uniref:Bug family tripartite tricarboxylate transporter substrate binding protein n=1 Tax=Ottowia thiooxydans TaxID=219182 RepID=UPI0004295692|nr:tripartite tricarboxylate transporter substrate binding protein [Ottowia thiooxydans]
MKIFPTTKRFFCAAAATFAASVVFAADSWPHKPVRLIVPYTAGGSNDVVARVYGERLSAYWGQPVIVENRPGVGGNLGAAFVAKSLADGYTLLITPNNLPTMNPYMYAKEKLGYDVAKDFEPISMMAQGPILLTVNAKLPVNSVRELVTYAKANAGKLSYASAGVGTPHHLTAELFKSEAGIDALHVPYRGAASAVTDLVGGEVQMMFGIPNSLMPFVRTGQLKALAVTSKDTVASLPGIPTVAGAYPGFSSELWIALMAPAGTPSAVTEKVRQSLARAAKDPQVIAKLEAQGLQSVAGSPAELRSAIQSESARWSHIIINSKITAE